MTNNNYNYRYLIKEKTISYLDVDDIMNNPYNINGMLNIICYHITDSTKYPFIQIIVEKIPHCNGIINEEFILPCVQLYNQTDTIENIVLKQTHSFLKKIGIDSINQDIDYNGILTDIFDEQYAVVDISNIDISNIGQLYRNSPLWFALPSEIINIGKICNIDICERLRELFTYMPELGILHDIDTKSTIPLPYAAYTGSSLKKCAFYSVFGNPKRTISQLNEKYYFFYKNFGNSVKEGGWIDKGGCSKIDMNDKTITHSNSNEILIDNEYGRYIMGGIVRYAIFSTYDSVIHTEETNDLTITDDIIKEYDTQVIFISFKTTVTNYKPNVLVKDYDSFIPLSYHRLDKRDIGINFDYQQKDIYMIA